MPQLSAMAAASLVQMAFPKKVVWQVDIPDCVAALQN
jgi:hypothetical protein